MSPRGTYDTTISLLLFVLHHLVQHTLPCGRTSERNLPQVLVKLTAFFLQLHNHPPHRYVEIPRHGVLAAATSHFKAGLLRGAGRGADPGSATILCPSLTFHTTYLFIRALKHFGILVGFCKIAKQEMSPDSQETIQNHIICQLV